MIGSPPAGSHQRRQRVGVGTDDAAGRDRFAGHGDLVAGGQDGNTRAAMHRQPGVVGGGGQSDIARGDAPSRRDHHVARREILALAPDMASRDHRLVDPDTVAVPGRILLQQDRRRRPTGPRCR